MKKIRSIILVYILICCSFGFFQILTAEENSIDLIDQNNRYCVGCNCAQTIMLSEGFSIAQSFTPTYNVLSKVLFFIKRTGDPPTMNITLSIRETLEGENLVSMEKEITGTEMLIDIEDINVVSGNLYYMIITIDEICTPEHGYGVYKTYYNSYYQGSFWTKVITGKWSENTENDMLFVTYWKDYSPHEPMIDGPLQGEAQQKYDYLISTTDPEGHEVEYRIDWGDGIITNWYGPYESGLEVIFQHQWVYEDNYTISVKSRDVFGAESDWVSMTMSLPKNREYFNPFIRFLENHPILYHIVHTILAL